MLAKSKEKPKILRGVTDESRLILVRFRAIYDEYSDLFWRGFERYMMNIQTYFGGISGDK
jgi:hypothetical protein